MKKTVVMITSVFILLVLTSCNPLSIQACTPIYAMDTTIQVTFYNQKDYESYYQEIKSIYNTYDRISSDFESFDNSSVYDLNQNRRITASEELIELMGEAIAYFNDTQGYYNPFVGRLSRLWKQAISDKAIVEDTLIKTELEILRNTSVQIDGNQITILGDGNVDLGGIAKGYATQKAKEYLDEQGVLYYLINAGSSNVAFTSKKEANFRLALEAPYAPSYIGIVEDKNIAIGTSSGKYQNTMIEGIRVHHLLNPFTGYPSNIYDNVNVLHENSTSCDVYSTAIFSMELEDAIEFAHNHELDILLYKDASIVYQTNGWKLYES